MIVAYIVCEKEENYCGAGYYLLTLDGNIIASHGCSNRDFANYDLTFGRIKELFNNKVDIVKSNDEIVYTKADYCQSDY